MPKLHELQESRSTAVAAMRAIADKAEAETRDYSDDEDKKHKALKTEIADLDAKIARARDLAEAERAAPAIVHHGSLGDGAYEDRARSFSLVKAINASLGDGADAGFEREISAEVKRRSGRTFQGIAVPDEYFHAERRTLLTSGDAASLYPEMHRGDLFIDRLRSQLVTGRLGATILDGLVGDQDIPKQTASSAAQWLAEDGALTETDAAFADVSLTPKTVGAMTSYSRRTLLNAVPSIEAIVRNDLSQVIARAIDFQAILGDGTGNTPVGVINATGANALSLAGPTWAEVLAFPAAIQSADADIGTFGWSMTPGAVATLRATVTVANGETMIMPAPDNLIGYNVATTTALPTVAGTPDTTSVVFGAWSQLLIGYWSGVDVLANPYEATAYSRGRVLLRAMRDCDVAVRHAEAFAFASDLAV